MSKSFSCLVIRSIGLPPQCVLPSSRALLPRRKRPRSTTGDTMTDTTIFALHESMLEEWVTFGELEGTLDWT